MKLQRAKSTKNVICFTAVFHKHSISPNLHNACLYLRYLNKLQGVKEDIRNKELNLPLDLQTFFAPLYFIFLLIGRGVKLHYACVARFFETHVLIVLTSHLSVFVIFLIRGGHR